MSFGGHDGAPRATCRRLVARLVGRLRRFLRRGGGAWLLKKYWETNITAPIRTKASSSRTSIDISLGGCTAVTAVYWFCHSMIPLDRTSPDGIDPAGLKRMAARQPAQPHPKSPRRAVPLHGFAHVLRAGRIEAAGGRQQGGHTQLVYAQTAAYDPLQRRKNFSTSRRSSGIGASNALRRGLMTMDHCGFNRSRWNRTASRTRRRMRLRTTALPSARGTVKPIWGPSGCGSRTENAAKKGQAYFAP